MKHPYALSLNLSCVTLWAFCLCHKVICVHCTGTYALMQKLSMFSRRLRLLSAPSSLYVDQTVTTMLIYHRPSSRKHTSEKFRIPILNYLPLNIHPWLLYLTVYIVDTKKKKKRKHDVQHPVCYSRRMYKHNLNKYIKI